MLLVKCYSIVTSFILYGMIICQIGIMAAMVGYPDSYVGIPFYLQRYPFLYKVLPVSTVSTIFIISLTPSDLQGAPVLHKGQLLATNLENALLKVRPPYLYSFPSILMANLGGLIAVQLQLATVP
jgi:hypothetical protein